MPEKLKMLRSRKYMPIPAVWNVLAMTDKRVKKVYGDFLSSYYHYYSPRQEVLVFYKEKEWIRLGQLITKKALNNKSFFKNLYEKQKLEGEKLLKISKNALEVNNETNIQTLLAFYKKIQDQWILYNIYNMPPWIIAADLMKKDIKGKLSPEITDQDNEMLFSPLKKSWSLREEEACYKSVFKISKNKSNQLASYADKLSGQFGWLPVSYDNINYWDEEYYIKKLNNLLKIKEKIKNRYDKLLSYEYDTSKLFNKLVKKYKIINEIIKELDVLHKLYIMQDDRKYYTFTSHLAWDKIITMIAKKLKVNKKIFKYILLSELIQNKNNVDKIKNIYENRHKDHLLFEGRFGESIKILSGNIAKKFISENSDDIDNSNILRGIVANRAGKVKIKGRANVLLSSRQIKEFYPGSILVTTMTSPDYIEAIRRSKAIITDEGGITCHAAIISRELNIPCIIATGIATKKIKNGKMLEVDIKNGIIKII